MTDSRADLDSRLRELWRAFAAKGLPLPGEPRLAIQLGASRPSVREALVRLESEGLIRRRRGAGTAVNADALAMAARFDLQCDFAALLVAAGCEPEVHLLSWSWEQLGAEDAEALEVASGTHALRSVKRWDANGTPAMVAIDLVPVLIPYGGSDHLPDDPSAFGVDPGGSLFAKVGPLTGEVVQWELARPSAEAAGPELAAWLELEPGTPLLTLDLVGVGRHRNRCYRAVEHHVPGAVEYGFIRTVRPTDGSP